MNICREEFDEEKEPDGMILSGWTQAIVQKNGETSKDNGASTSNVSQTVSVEAEEDDEVQIIAAVGGLAGKKRKLPDNSNSSSSDLSCVSDETRISRKAKNCDDSEADIMLDGNGERKKKKVQ